MTTATGNCFHANGELFMDRVFIRGETDLRLVHGEVTGQSSLRVLKYAHCWIEKGNTVIDISNGNSVKMDKATYYAIGQVGDNVHTYDAKQFQKKVCKHEHWGPWDLKTESEL